MKRANVAIIGCGQWGQNFVRILSRMPGVKITGVCDLNSERIAYVRNTYNNITTYSDYNAVLLDKKTDAVIISTPVSSHYKISKEAMGRDKHVLVEKPISLRSTEALELVGISKKNKKVLMVGHTFLFNPAVIKIKEIIKNNILGRIYYIHSRRTNLGPLRDDCNAIWDLSPHDISIMNYLFERLPEEVAAYGQKFLAHRFEDVGFIALKYNKNMLAHIHVSWLDPKKTREMTIVGNNKMLVYDDTNPTEPIRIYDKKVMKKKYEKLYSSFKEFQLIVRDGNVTAPKIEQEEPLKAECRHFIDCIKNDKGPIAGGQEGLDVVKVLEGIGRSLNSNGTKVKVR